MGRPAQAVYCARSLPNAHPEQLLLKKLYTIGSLKNVNGSVEFSIKNRLSDAEFVGRRSLRIDGGDIPR